MNRKQLIAFAGAVALVVAAGCSGGDAPQRSRPSARPAEDGAAGQAAAAPGAMGTAVVKGTVAFEGDAPKARSIRMDADPFCQKAHTSGATSEEVLVNENGTLKNVFVYVKEGIGGSYPPPAEPLVLDQNGCTYHPHVSGMIAGQILKVLNSDDTLHNIHALPKNNPQFNIAMPKYVKEKEQTFANPEVMVPIKCDVHSWMATYIGVVSHPFFSVTGNDGSFDLSKLPAGTYTLEAWHEKYGTQTQQVTVGDGETREVSFTFQAS
jgi:hypothetical protein